MRLSPITVRPAAREDAAALAALDTQWEIRRWLDLPPEADDPAAWERAYIAWIERPDHRCVVATLPEGEIVGSVTLRAAAGDVEGACLALKVDAAHQGRGIGTALLGWLTATADALNLACVYLEVLRENHRAITLYAAHGFIYDDTDADGCDRMVRPRALF